MPNITNVINEMKFDPIMQNAKYVIPNFAVDLWFNLGGERISPVHYPGKAGLGTVPSS